MAGTDKPDKTEGGATGGRRPSRRRKVTRAPILDLEATEIKGAAAAEEPVRADTPVEAEAAGPEQAMPEPEPAVEPEPGAQAEPGPERAAAPPKVPASDGMVTIAVSALAGAIATGVLVITLSRMGVLTPEMPAQSTVDLATLEARIDAAEMAAAQRLPAGDEGLAERMSGLERAAGKSAEMAGSLSEQVAVLSGRLDKLDSTLAETGSKAQSALTGLQGIESAVREIANRPADGSATPSTDALELRIADLAQRLDRVVEEAKTAAAGNAGQRLDALDRNLAELRDTIAETRAGLQSLSGIVTAMPQAVDSKTVDDLKQEVGSRLDAIEARMGGPGETRGAAAALALASLGRAVRDGEAFETELAAFEALVPDDPSIAVLEPHAGSGYRTRAELVANFPEVAKQIQDVPAASRDDGLGARIVARLKSVVTVRRTGDAGGDNPKAVVARMAKAVKAGDLEGAASEGEAAGEALPELAARWVAAVRDRLDAERALDDADGRMIAILGRTGG